MTEQEWLTCTDPSAMLNFLRGKARNRKFRLFACSCCRQFFWHLLSDSRSRMAVMSAERYADQVIGRRELRAVEGLASEVTRGLRPRQVDDPMHKAALAAVWASSGQSWWSAHFVLQLVVGEDRLRGCNFLRDIIGPYPGQRVSIDPSCLSWQESIVVKIAQAIYAERCFGNLPVLADALEEAGCTDADILNHCRKPGKRARGCWVVDLLLGKS